MPVHLVLRLLLALAPDTKAFVYRSFEALLVVMQKALSESV